MSTPSTARERLVGLWRLVSIRERSGGGSESDDPRFGPDPEGRLLYTEDGLVSVHFMRSRRAPWSNEESPTDAERAESAAGYGAYAGRYTVEEAAGFVLHHVDVALIPNRVGKDLQRFFSFSGNRLTLKPPPVIRGGVEIQRSLVWERE